MKKSICALLMIGLFFAGVSYAMGKAPEKKEPKYKLEILKMELIPTATLSIGAVTGKKVLFVLPAKDYQETEYAKPREILEKAGIKVVVASSAKGTALGMSGGKVKPDLYLKEAKASDYDAVVFIGGDGALKYVDDPQALSLAIEAKKNDKVIGAICVAPMILAKAGVLEGKRAAVSPYGRQALNRAGAKCTGSQVEVDGKIVTGKGPGASEDFGRAILKLLK